MRTLIVGMGAVGGTIAARALSAGIPVRLAARTLASAESLKSSGLKVSGVGGPASASSFPIGTLEQYLGRGEKFDLILLATKADDALKIASVLPGLLHPGATVLPIQNGSAPELLAKKLGTDTVLGGLSNLGATMAAPGIYEQRNAGHLRIGEMNGGLSQRSQQIAQHLSPAIETLVTENMRGAIWSKLLLNCSVTTIGAIAGQTMRQYIQSGEGKELFRKVYDETLSVAFRLGVQPEKMLVDPVPSGWSGTSPSGPVYDDWIDEVLRYYGDVKPSMLQDFERGRKTEIDFINGYIERVGNELGIPAPINSRITALVHRIEEGLSVPHPSRLSELLS